MDKAILKTFEESLARCNANRAFLQVFYDKFLASSPKVQEKFANTDFEHQRRALRASLHVMLLAAGDEAGPQRYLQDLAERHSSRQLDIGSELYDLWLDSLIAAVHECDPQFGPEVEEAWEKVLFVGIDYLLKRY